MRRMDFMKLLKSLEELLYEVVSWLIFYPVTLWRSVTRPLDMMQYADAELGDSEDAQYDDTINPPLFLLITLMMAQGVSAAFPSNAAIQGVGPLESGSNLLIVRGVLFSVFPLVMAVSLLLRKRVRLTRDALRPPFYSQCYVAAPFAFLIGLAFDIMLMPSPVGAGIGAAVLALSSLWYVSVEVRWFRRDLSIGTALAIVLVLRGVLIASTLFLALAMAIAFESRLLATQGACESTRTPIVAGQRLALA